MNNPVQDIIRGMYEGALTGHMLRRGQMEQEQMAMARVKAQRDNEEHDIRQRVMLGQLARPVAGGAVEDVQSVNADLPQNDPLNPGTPKMVKQKMPVLRKADKSRVVKHRGMDGQETEYELRTPQEQAQSQLQQQLAATEAVTRLKGGIEQEFDVAKETRAVANARTKRQQDLQDEGLPVPPELAKRFGLPANTRILPQHLDDLVRSDAYGENVRNMGEDRKERATNLEADRRERAIDREERRRISEADLNDRAVDRAERRQIMAGRGSNMTPNKQADLEQKEQAYRHRLKAGHDVLDTQTAELWSQHKKIADAWKSNQEVWDFDQKQKEAFQVKDGKKKPVKGQSEENRNRVQSTLESLRQQIEGVERVKRERLSELKKREAGGMTGGDPNDPGGFFK
jgi:hypothetical protein